MTHKQLLQKLRQLGMVSADNIPVLFTQFKNRATIANYGRKGNIILIGVPQRNLFGFYIPTDKHPDMMKDAYTRYLNLVKGKMDDVENKVIQWGNAGVPLDYLPLRTAKK